MVQNPIRTFYNMPQRTKYTSNKAERNSPRLKKDNQGSQSNTIKAQVLRQAYTIVGFCGTLSHLISPQNAQDRLLIYLCEKLRSHIEES